MKRVPISVNSLTIEQYQKFRAIEDSEPDLLIKGNKLLSLVTGLTEDQVDSLPIWKAEYLFKQIGQLRSTIPTKRIKKSIWIKGKRYTVCKSEKHLNANQFTIADTLQLDSVKHLHLLAATIYMRHPLFRKKRFDAVAFTELAEEMKKRKIGELWGAVFFYSVRLMRTKKVIQGYSEAARSKVEARMVEVERILEGYGIDTGGTTSSILSQVEILSKKMN